MKKLVNAFFIVLFSATAYAQNVAVSGVVKNQAGNVLPAAMVEVLSTNAIIRVDSAGTFSIGVKPKAKLLISSPGYDEKQVNINGNNNLTIVLNAKEGTDVNAVQAALNTGATNQFANGTSQIKGAAASLVYGNSGANIGSLLTQITHTEGTKGSRYLYNDWAQGTVISSKDSVISNPAYSFNYDKINGDLLLSQDKEHAIAINKEQIKMFTLHKEGEKDKTFQMAPLVDDSHFVEVLSAGKNYNIYRKLSTKLVKNNYTTDGMTSRGNNYDEFVDESEYFVLDVKSNQVHKLTLKKKGIKEAFNADAKVDTYLAANGGSIDDNYLVRLGNFLNK